MLEFSLKEELEQLQQNSLYRGLTVIEKSNGVYAEIDNRMVTLFCGNDYLGFSRCTELKNTAMV